MEVLNEMKLSFPSRSQNEAFARSAVSAFIAPLDPTVEQLNDVKAAVSEAVTNCIVHAYPDEIGAIELYARITAGRTLYIRIKDKGCGIADIKQAMTPLYTSCAEGERAGLGFAVMECFTDKLTVRSTPEKGTSVAMTKCLVTKDEQF